MGYTLQASVTLGPGEERPVTPVWVASAVVVEPAEPAPVVAEPRPAPGGVSPWPWVAIGVGGGVALAGGACSLVAWLDRRAVTDATTTNGLVTGISRSDARKKQREANDLTMASWALYAVGGAAVVTGIVLAVLPRTDASAPPPPSAGLSPVPGGAMALVSGTF